MPYNILLLPLLAGFLFIARARIFSYATSQLQKEQLLLWASLAGLCFLLISRIVCLSMADTQLGRLLLEAKAAIAPFPYMGTAVGTLLIAGFLIVALNCLIPEYEVGLWVYHGGGFDQLESLLLFAAIGAPQRGRLGFPALFWKELNLDLSRTSKRWADFLKRRPQSGGYSAFEMDEPKLVMISLGDNKVYVGFISQLPPATASKLTYVRILPVWSGYRDKDDRTVSRTTDYEEALLAANDRDLLIKVVPAKEIMAAGIHVDGTFPIRDIVKSPTSQNFMDGWKPVLRQSIRRSEDA